MLVGVFWLDAVDENFAFVVVDFHAVTSNSFLQSISELLEFFFTALPPPNPQQIDVVSKPQNCGECGHLHKR